MAAEHLSSCSPQWAECLSKPSTSIPALVDQQMSTPDTRYYIKRIFLQVWDMRTLKPGSSISQASRQPLRDVDWAAATPHVLSTVGDDQRLRVWDLRCWRGHSAQGVDYSWGGQD